MKSGAKRKKERKKDTRTTREALPASETTRLMVSFCSSRDGHTGSAGWDPFTHCTEPPDQMGQGPNDFLASSTPFNRSRKNKAFKQSDIQKFKV